MGQGKVAIAF